ncbi:MAG TPA: dipeptide epimerase [Candidatus Acidoferrales bacterium]|nr:dipeptide epimerase [Candidatus Acidoferrales bacterium]
MRLEITELSLPLVHPFTIARSSITTSRTALLRLRDGDLEGLGEASPIPRYGESVESIRAYFAATPLRSHDPYELETLLEGIPPAARCALDVALHDLIGKDLERPLYRLFGLDPARMPVTSFTIGIDTLEKTLEKVGAVADHPILKIKLGRGHEIETVEAIRSRYAGTVRLDANEGWTPEESVRILRELERFDIEFCEQPIPAGTPEALRFVHERTTIPIVADEDASDAASLARLVGCVDGVNVKLVKCGGLRAALAMIHTARALGLKIMLGCMVESAVLSTAAAHLSPLADWADIDGPFLTAHDPFRGVTYDRGKLLLPEGAGLGVRETVANAPC